MKNIRLYVLLSCLLCAALPAQADQEYGWDARQNRNSEKSFWDIVTEEAEKVDAIQGRDENSWYEREAEYEEPQTAGEIRERNSQSSSLFDDTHSNTTKRRVVKPNEQYQPYEPFQNSPPPPMSQAVRSQLQKR